MIKPAKAQAIARGEDTFSTIVPVVPGPYVNRWLRNSVIFLSIIVMLSCSALVAGAIFRSIERRNTDAIIKANTQTLNEAQARILELNDIVADNNAELRCRAASQVEVDRATTQLQVTIAEQFASALDMLPPAPDPAVLAKAADDAELALDARAQAIVDCAKG